MSALPVIFSLTLVGSCVRMSVDLALKWMAPKAHGSIATSPDRAFSTPVGPVDPVFRFGFILAGDGAIVLALVSALPGALGLQRTCLAFALLCVGGLVGEISSTGFSAAPSSGDAPDQQAAAPRPRPRSWSLASMVVLNLGVAVLSSRQGLIDIVPPHGRQVHAVGAQELDPVVVVARRSSDPLEDRGGAY
jgi:hypothetical protein